MKIDKNNRILHDLDDIYLTNLIYNKSTLGCGKICNFAQNLLQGEIPRLILEEYENIRVKNQQLERRISKIMEDKMIY